MALWELNKALFMKHSSRESGTWFSGLAIMENTRTVSLYEMQIENSDEKFSGLNQINKSNITKYSFILIKFKK